MRGLVVDLFAGGGGASTGLEAALGRPVDIAINHDPIALAAHKANHPHTLHLEADIWEVKPQEATQGRPVAVLWASPDCTHFSVAKGGKPRKQNIRSLAWAVVRWASAVRPALIMLENVAEFRGWGPLRADNRPDKARKGETFRRWKRKLEALGYVVDYRVLDASEYGAPTRRRRLFLVARCDGQAIRWPQPTHGSKLLGLAPFHTAAECIDWTIPCPSIFERARPLAPATLRRIARGVMRYVVNEPHPFIVPVKTWGGGGNEPRDIDAPMPTITTSKRGEYALVAPALINTRNGERDGQKPRVRDIREPYGTVTAKGSQGALVAAFLARHYGGHENDGSSLSSPLFTITTQDHHALVAAFLLKYYGTDQDPRLDAPLDTVTTKDRFGLVTVSGEQYRIADIGMRMLEPHELLRAQFGRFAAGYDLSAARTKTAKVRLIGNSVCPEVAEAVARANVLPADAKVAA